MSCAEQPVETEHLATEDGTILTRGHYQRIQSGYPTSHCEAQCIRNAGRRRDWRELTLVRTLSPFPMRSGTAVLLGFRRVLSASVDRRATQLPRC